MATCRCLFRCLRDRSSRLLMRASTCTRRTLSARVLGRGACDLASTGSSVHRYYDPTTAQFTSVDPLVQTTGQPYQYTEGDPVNGVDPMGLWGLNPISDVAQAAGDVGHFVMQHHQVIEQVATIGGAIVGMAACDAATAGLCSAFTPVAGALVGTALYAEGGGSHTAQGYAMAFASGGVVGSLSMVWGGVATAGAALWMGDATIGAGGGIYDYARSPGCHSLGGFLRAGATGATQNAPIKLGWLFGHGGE